MASTAQPRPGPLGLPPASLSSQTLPVISFDRPLRRIHQIQHTPLFFGRTGHHRFDAPQQQFAVLYASTDAHGAFIETFGDSQPHAVSVNSLSARGVAVVTLNRALALVDLTGAGLAQVGADARLFAAEHAIARAWSLALWTHPATVDGLYYPARHDPSRPSVALYDRAADAVSVDSQGSLMDPANATLIADVLDTYGFALI